MSKMVDPGNQDVTESSFSLIPHALGVHAACRVAMPKDNGLRVRSGTKLLLHRGIVAGAALGARGKSASLLANYCLQQGYASHFGGGKR